MRLLVTWLIVLGFLATGVLALKMTVLAPKPVPVDVEPADRGTVELTVTNSRAGTVKARLRARLSPEITGRIMEIPHREGAVVRAGDVLVRLDPRSADAALAVARKQIESARADLDEVKTRLEHAARDLQRKKKLLETGGTPEEVVEEYRNRLEVLTKGLAAAEVRVDAAEAALEQAEVERSKTVIHAPFDGVITDVSGEVGELATPVVSVPDPSLSAGPILEVVDLSRLYVSAEIDEVDMGRLTVGLPVRITLDPYPDQTFRGEIVRVAETVSDVQEKNRTVEVEVEFAATDEVEIRPGTSADVEVILESREDILRVPSHALLEGDRVLVLVGGHLEERELVIGIRNWDFAQVDSGLAAGDPVVTSLDREEVKAGALAFEGKPGR